MSEKYLSLKCCIHYYAMSKFYRTMLSTTVDAMRAFGDLKNNLFKFYYSMALSLEERLPESNREAEMLQENDEFLVVSLLILVNNMKKTSNNKDEITKLETKIRTIRKTASDLGLYYAALYLFFIERYDKCKEYIDRALKLTQNKQQNNDYYLLKGWLEYKTSKDETGLNLAMKYFEISSKSNDPECLIAKAATLSRLKKIQKALDTLDDLIAHYPNLLPAYIEKIKINVEISNWEQILEISTKCTTIDRHCLDASCYIILYYLIWNFNEQQVCLKLNDLATSLEIREPKNARCYYELSRLFSQLACDNKEIILITFSMIEKAVFIDSRSTYLCELGYQSLKLDRTDDGERYFKNAHKIDPNNLDVLYGLLLIALKKDDKEFIKQIKNLESNYELNQMPIILLYMCALIKKHEKAPFKEINLYLNIIVERHLALIKDLNLGLKYYLELNVELILNIVKMYLEYGPVEPVLLTNNKNEKQNSVVLSSHFIKQCERYLKPILTSCPSHSQAIYLMAKIKYLLGDFKTALRLLDQFIERSTLSNDALLLKSKILILQNKTKQASQTLESALSHSFQIRDNIDYTLLKARILKQENKLNESLKILEDLKSNLINNQRKKLSITDYDQITLDLMLSEFYSTMNRQEESNQIINDLLNKYKGTIHEKRILIVNSSIEESLGNIEDAVLILKKIQFSNKQKLNSLKDTNEFNNELEFYIKSKECLANIYLKYYKDRKLYAKCFEDILEINPSIESHLILGNAYLNILEPEKAVEIFEQALKKNPKDAILMRKVGQLYIQIHLYEKAITYYKAAIKTSGYNDLKYDLANLLSQIKRYDESVEIINNAKEFIMNNNNQNNQLEILEFEAKINYLLANIHLENNRKEQAISSLISSNNAQTKVMRRLMSENPDSLITNRSFAIKICIELADQVFIYHRNHKQTSSYLKEALNYDSNNNEVLLRLARLELSVSNLEEVHNYCRSILKNNPDNHDALLILAEIMFRKNQFDNSLQLFQQILNSKPDNMLALSRLIEAARRCGQLIELIPTAIEKAEKSINETSISFNYQTIKLSYCKALYNYYLGSIEDAIKLFVISKNDNIFGIDSLYKIINILINPENEIIGGEMFHNLDEESTEELNKQELSIKLAEKFLTELQKNYADTIEIQLMKSFIIFSIKQKNEVDYAINNLLKLLNEQMEENIKLNYGIATGQMVNKQFSKAKAILKRSTRLNWVYSDADYYEKNWLLLSDIYIQTGKFDQATEILKRCLMYNKSCIKAFELLGLISEKEQDYHESSDYYQKAWILSNQKNTRIGYRLAVCFMKSRQFIESIDICELLLQNDTIHENEHKRIKKDILDKCKLFVI